MAIDRTEYFKAYYQARKEKHAARSKAWREANPERVKEHCRKANLKRHDWTVAYRAATFEKRQAWQRAYNAAHQDEASKERRREKDRKWEAANGAAYRVANRDRIRQVDAAWRAANVEHILAYKAENADSNRAKRRVRESANPEKYRAYRLEWSRKNPEKRRANYQKWFAKYGQQYRENNRGKLRAYSAKRKAVMLNATPPWADLDAITVVYERAAELGMHVDHIVPLQGKNVCGLHIAENLQLLTETENKSKGNKFAT